MSSLVLGMCDSLLSMMEEHVLVGDGLLVVVAVVGVQLALLGDEERFLEMVS